MPAAPVNAPAPHEAQDWPQPPELRETVRLTLQRFEKAETDEERQEIAHELELLGPAGLTQAEQLIRFPAGRLRPHLLLLLVILAIYGDLLATISTLSDRAFSPVLTVLLCVVSLAAIVYGIYFARSDRTPQLTHEIFGWLQDKRSLPAMFQMFGWYGPTGAPRRGLTSLLLQLGPADRTLLDPRQAKQLTDILHQYTAYAYAANQDQTDFCVAVLHALQYVGTAASLPTLRSFTEMEVEACGGNPIWRTNAERIKAQAVASLQTLTQTLDQESNSTPLLRPSAAPPDASLLLHPAAPTPAGEEPLVRPVNTNPS